MMNKILANPLFTAMACFAATFAGKGIHILLFHTAFNLEEILFEAALFAIIGGASVAARNIRLSKSM